MLKILLLNDYLEGGGAEGVFRTSIALLEKEHEVDFLVGSEKIKKPKNLKSYLCNSEFMQKLEEKLNKFHPDVIHIHNYYHFLSPGIFHTIKKFKKKHTVKVILTAHDYHLISPSSGLLYHEKNRVKTIDVNNNSLRSILFKRIDHRGFKYSFVKKMQWIWAIKISRIIRIIDMIIAPSYFLKEAFEKSNIQKEIQMIRNPFETDNTKSISKTPVVQEIKLLFIGRLSREKGLLEFLKALDTNKVANLSFDILGDGEQASEIKGFIKEKQLDYISMHGHKTQSEVQQFLTSSNVLLLPSVWYENAPLSLIEGATFKNIILASDLGGIRELTKLTESYVLVKDWSLEVNSALKEVATKKINKITNPSEFTPENYVTALHKIYTQQ